MVTYAKLSPKLVNLRDIDGEHRRRREGQGAVVCYMVTPHLLPPLDSGWTKKTVAYAKILPKVVNPEI